MMDWTPPPPLACSLTPIHAPTPGIVIILVALTVFVIIGLAGLAIDLCRIYITQNELQNFTDSGAIWAVSRLDGTNPGIAAARVAALPAKD